MNYWDYIVPHRMTLNAVLRKDAQLLREKIGLYQIEYDKKKQSIEDELVEAEESVNRKLNDVRLALNQELKDTQLNLESFSDDFIKYIHKHLYYSGIKNTIRCYSSILSVLNEDMIFLSKQIDSLKVEISHLKERKRQLISLADVKDVVDLATQNGYSLCAEDNARALLQSVDGRIKLLINPEDRYERYALKKLRLIVQERTEYLYAVDYISWVISIKRQYIKQLINLFKDKKNESDDIKRTISRLESEQKEFDNDISILATRVRNYWSNPIAHLNVDISYLRFSKKNLQDKIDIEKDKAIKIKYELDQVYEKLDEVSSDYEYMRNMGVDDEYQWDSLKSKRSELRSKRDNLKREKNRVSNEIEALNSKKMEIDNDITKKEQERDEWFDLRKHILIICKKYKCTKNGYMTINDETRILNERLAEIEIIRADGIETARKLCDIQKKTLHDKYIKEVDFYDNQINSLTRECEEKNRYRDQLIEKLQLYKVEVEIRKRNDTRGFFAKLVSDAPVVEQAKYVVKTTRKEIGLVTNEINELVRRINELRNSRLQVEANYKSCVDSCMPICLRPTQEELLEEKKIKMRLSAIRVNAN